MSRPLRFRRFFALALVTSGALALYGCSDDGSSGGGAPVGGAGGGGTSNGKGGSDAGEAGRGDAGSDAGEGGNGDGGSEPSDGGKGGSSGAGGSGSAGKGGSSGKGGAGGSGGAKAFPETCEESHGYVGCCASDTLLYAFEHGQVIEFTCEDGAVCGWDADFGGYDCVDAGGPKEDPTGKYPAACYGAPIEGVCGPECETSEDCSDSGYGASCLPDKQLCGCTTNAHCADNPNGNKCDAATSECGCKQDADCTDELYPVCNPGGYCDEE